MKYSIIIGLMMLLLMVAITVLGIIGYKCKNRYDNYGITETQLDCDPRVDTTKL